MSNTEPRPRFSFALIALSVFVALSGCNGSNSGGGTDGGCTPGEQRCFSALAIEICDEAGQWASSICPDPPAGECDYVEWKKGCLDDACWWECEDESVCHEWENYCADDTYIWRCAEGGHGGAAYVEGCAYNFPSDCACGAWCVGQSAPDTGDPAECVCDCPGTCEEHSPGDPGCECCEFDAGVDGGVDAGPDSGTTAPDAG